ncbi:DUF4288 domain-containing protein [Nocardia aurea]|uniref:DUF4288 domain-containing protein n=1 Tax=Nocardia aurea TaxID=2144174 RepID=A0ABV3G2D5_9NOCA
MTNRTPFVAVLLYESTSDAADYEVMYQEDFVLLYAESEEAARKLALDKAKEQECTYQNGQGETITLSLKHVIDVASAVSDDLTAGGDLYTRHFRDYASYRRMEPLLNEKPL